MKNPRRLMVWLALALLSLAATPRVQALIMGDSGNAHVKDPGWPGGAAAAFNIASRVAWWEGPPLGGGEWHAECRGDAAAFNRALTAFAAIDVHRKVLVVHDGVGQSFWLNPNRDPAKEPPTTIDWEFIVWQPERWKVQQTLPVGLRSEASPPSDELPPPRMEAYAGGNIDWSEIKIPDGVEVIDHRLEAHGFSLDDGVVLQGRVTDLTSGQPLMASVTLQRVGPQPSSEEQPALPSARCDADGNWVLKSVPEGQHRVVAEADGYVSRIIGYGRYSAQPRWERLDGRLARRSELSGRVVDVDGVPVEGAEVDVYDIAVEGDTRYDSPQKFRFVTDADGRFSTDLVPPAKVRVRALKPGYVLPGLGAEVQLPAEDLELRMHRAATLTAVVDFGDVPRPEGYLVTIEPEGGAVVGSWGGSANIDAAGAVEFKNIPPGRYRIFGRPNPGADSQQTDAIDVELVGGRKEEVVLKAK